ncbi:hypothetical protein CHUAL_008956 [Chamberlinius hualienensis]
MFGPKSQKQPERLLKINTTTHHVDIIPLVYDDDFWELEGQCVIKDHVYIILINVDYSGILIISVNLKTFKIKKINYSNEELFRGLIHYKCIDHESNLNFYCEKIPFIIIYDIVNDNWRTIENVNFVDYKNKFTTRMFMQSDEVAVFKKNQLPNYDEHVEINNFNVMKWKSGSFEGKRQFDDSFSYYFEFNGKLATIKNSQNAINRSRYIDKSKLIGPDEMEIYVLDLNPSLQCLCATRISEFNLDQSKLPKKLQNEIKQYLTI